MTIERVLLLGILAAIAASIAADAMEPSGRYQIASTDRFGAFRLDTATGEVCWIPVEGEEMLEMACGEPGLRGY